MAGGRRGFRILVAKPHGFCTGVRRAIALAEKALAEACGTPLYGFHELVHNRQVVERLAAAGLTFVDDVAAVPPGGTLLFSAHGVSPAVREAASARGIRVLDATCVFVGKLHESVRRFAAEGYTVLLVGRRSHDEVVGVAGEAPQAVRVVETASDVEAVEVPDPGKVVVLAQTTLAACQVAPVVSAVRRRFPSARLPAQNGICLATTERQEAVRRLAGEADVVLVLGSAASANSNRLVDVARAAGARAVLLPDAPAVAAFVESGGLAGASCVGVSAGASTPEDAVERAVALLEAAGGAVRRRAAPPGSGRP